MSLVLIDLYQYKYVSKTNMNRTLHPKQITLTFQGHSRSSSSVDFESLYMISY